MSLPFIHPKDIFKRLCERTHGEARQLASTESPCLALVAVSDVLQVRPYLTRDGFAPHCKETVKERAQNVPAFRIGLLTEAAECMLNNEVNVAKSLLRDYVNATLGFKELGQLIDKKPQNLMRMLSARGNPSLGNISAVIASLRQHEGIDLHVSAR